MQERLTSAKVMPVLVSLYGELEAVDCDSALGVQIVPTVCPVLLCHELQSNIQNI